jgi:hypothetical protein
VFDELAWAEDLAGASDSARDAASEARRRIERDGQRIADLRATEAQAADGTRLPGCAKAYVPPPVGPWGFVFRLARDPADGRLVLAYLAFGLRHPPSPSRRPSVYELAHHRLHAGAE